MLVRVAAKEGLEYFLGRVITRPSLTPPCGACRETDQNLLVLRIHCPIFCSSYLVIHESLCQEKRPRFA
ncbi:hypothetical protein Bind_2369 [Beijerinckia indica subsp. indica ATCC 9039]|uniref:Uncharacterized protein n=1 Tax=Beijerinckia indica subsp. indica (strain ATCC 9039 / DSM 1715 / NCIMB 8712) TaxID=395963 RepID=B2IHT7_BEII9|nr:hypothetical protein Bind_2369 [Beijerinckia indica subsp. indica ATCC 9039]